MATANKTPKEFKVSLSEQDKMDVCCGLSILAEALEAEAKKLDERFGSYTEAHSLRERATHIVLRLRQKFGAKDRSKAVKKMDKEKTEKGQKTIDDEISARQGEGRKAVQQLTEAELQKHLKASQKQKAAEQAADKKTTKKVTKKTTVAKKRRSRKSVATGKHTRRGMIK